MVDCSGRAMKERGYPGAGEEEEGSQGHTSVVVLPMTGTPMFCCCRSRTTVHTMCLRSGASAQLIDQALNAVQIIYPDIRPLMSYKHSSASLFLGELIGVKIHW